MWHSADTKKCVALLDLWVRIVGRSHHVLFYHIRLCSMPNSFPIAFHLLDLFPLCVKKYNFHWHNLIWFISSFPKMTTSHGIVWFASFGLSPTRLTSMAWAHLLHLSFSTRGYFEWCKLLTFHLFVCFKKTTSHGITWSASSDLPRKFLLPMALAHLLHLIFSPKDCFQWHGLLSFIWSSHTGFSPKRITLNSNPCCWHFDGRQVQPNIAGLHLD